MKSPAYSPLVALAALCFFTTVCHAQPAANQIVSLSTLKTVTDGNYLVTLEVDGKPQLLNLSIQGNKAKCVNSSEARLKAVQGQLQYQADGVFLARLQGGAFRASQFWIFRADGGASIREIPDRGEQQSAVPVSGASLEKPTKK